LRFVKSIPGVVGHFVVDDVTDDVGRVDRLVFLLLFVGVADARRRLFLVGRTLQSDGGVRLEETTKRIEMIFY
jgi:hypothetical protein